MIDEDLENEIANLICPEFYLMNLKYTLIKCFVGIVSFLHVIILIYVINTILKKIKITFKDFAFIYLCLTNSIVVVVNNMLGTHEYFCEYQTIRNCKILTQTKRLGQFIQTTLILMASIKNKIRICNNIKIKNFFEKSINYIVFIIFTLFWIIYTILEWNFGFTIFNDENEIINCIHPNVIHPIWGIVSFFLIQFIPPIFYVIINMFCLYKIKTVHDKKEKKQKIINYFTNVEDNKNHAQLLDPIFFKYKVKRKLIKFEKSRIIILTAFAISSVIFIYPRIIYEGIQFFKLLINFEIIDTNTYTANILNFLYYLHICIITSVFVLNSYEYAQCQLN